MQLPSDLTQFLDNRYVIEFNGGNEFDNRVTTAMHTWQVAQRVLREADKLRIEIFRMQLRRTPK